jgi:hypothetical protein
MKGNNRVNFLISSLLKNQFLSAIINYKIGIMKKFYNYRWLRMLLWGHLSKVR